MAISQFFMKLLSFSLLLSGVYSFETKNIADPVARHDVKQCSQYLCPAFPNAAENFMADGCDGLFNDYVLSLDEIDSTTSSPGVSTTTLVAISGTCGLVALIVGFITGSREETSGYEPVPSL